MCPVGHAHLPSHAESQLAPHGEFSQDVAGRETNKAPFVVLGGFALLFGGLLYQKKLSGQSLSYGFGEARVKAQGVARKFS